MNATAHIRRSLPHIAVATLSIVILAAIAIAHLRSPSHISNLARSFENSLHGPGFAVFAVFVFAILRIYHHSPTNYRNAAAIAMAIGVLSELAQFPGPRDASLSDLVLDAIGIIAGLGIVALFDRSVRTSLDDKLILALGAASVLASAVIYVPTAWYGYAAVYQYRALPTLLEFDGFWERAIYGQTWKQRPELVAAPSGWPDASNMIAYTKETGRFGLLIRLEPYPDWSKYASLSFLAASGDAGHQEIIVTVRERRPQGRRRANRYSRPLSVGPEPTRYVIDLEEVRSISNGQPFDISHVSAVSFHAADPGSGTSIFVDDFRLE